MIEKMKALATDGKFREALIIGQNLFARNSGNLDTYKAYAALLETVMDIEDTFEGKMRYFQNLSSVLTVFSETVSIQDDMIDFIMTQENKLEKLFNEIQQLQKQEERAYVKKKVMANDDVLAHLPNLMNELQKSRDKTYFDTLLQQLQQCDALIDKAYLTERQKNLYDSITQQCSKIVDTKVCAFQRVNDAEYNEQALAAYERVYQYFKNGKIPDNHKEIISGLFGFDANRLFNETLTYYNHVYAYILSKLDDNGKFKLTKAAIRSEIRR